MPPEYIDYVERLFWRDQDAIAGLTFPEDESYEEHDQDEDQQTTLPP